MKTKARVGFAWAWLFLLDSGSMLQPVSPWMEFQCAIKEFSRYAQGLSGFTKDCEPLEGRSPSCFQTLEPLSPLPTERPSPPWTGGLQEDVLWKIFPDSNCKTRVLSSAGARGN